MLGAKLTILEGVLPAQRGHGSIKRRMTMRNRAMDPAFIASYASAVPLRDESLLRIILETI
jgi:hypothetical protein